MNRNNMRKWFIKPIGATFGSGSTDFRKMFGTRKVQEGPGGKKPPSRGTRVNFLGPSTWSTVELHSNHVAF